MRLSSTRNFKLRCQSTECLGFIEADLSKIEKAEIISCNFSHRHLVITLETKRSFNTERYEIELYSIDNPGSYLQTLDNKPKNGR